MRLLCNLFFADPCVGVVSMWWNIKCSLTWLHSCLHVLPIDARHVDQQKQIPCHCENILNIIKYIKNILFKHILMYVEYFFDLFLSFLIFLKTKKTRIEKWRRCHQFSARELRSEPFLCIFRFGPEQIATGGPLPIYSNLYQFIAIYINLRTGPGPKRKMHKKGSDRSSRAENWSHRRHFSMRVFFCFQKKTKKWKKSQKHIQNTSQ